MRRLPVPLQRGRVRPALLGALVVTALVPAVPDPARLHRDAVVVDLHADTVQDLAAGRRALGGGGGGQVDLPRLRRGGVDVQVFALYVGPQYAPGRAYARARALLGALRREVRAHASEIGVVTTVGGIGALVRAGKVAAVVAIENGDALEDDPARVDEFYRLGVRMLSLTWNRANALADGAREARNGGLTAFGRAVLARMQRLGMIVDVSHLSERSFWDVLDATSGPVVASHSDAAALQPDARNLSDLQLRAIAARGGVVGITFYPEFLGGATLDRVLDHIAHVARVAGIDSVALGSDFDGITSTPAGLEDVSKLPGLTAGLVRRGYSAEAITRMLGANALRVFEAVWRK